MEIPIVDIGVNLVQTRALCVSGFLQAQEITISRRFPWRWLPCGFTLFYVGRAVRPWAAWAITLPGPEDLKSFWKML